MDPITGVIGGLAGNLAGNLLGGASGADAAAMNKVIEGIAGNFIVGSMSVTMKIVQDFTDRLEEQKREG